MPTERVKVVWLYGPPAAGKTTTGWAVYRALPGPARGYVDIDQLGMCYPVRGDDPQRDGLKARALGRVLENLHARGADLVIVSGVLDPALLPLYQGEAPEAGFTLCRVTASPAEIRRRQMARGWDEASANDVIGHAHALDPAEHPHATVDTTTGSPSEIAQRVVQLTGLSTMAPAQPIRALPLAASQAPGRVLFLIGPGSVGKSTIAWSLFTRSQARGTTGLVDTRQVGFLEPAPKGDPGRHRLKAANVAALWSAFHSWGARTLVVNGRIEDDRVVRVYRDALPAADVCVVRLRAGGTELARRLTERVRGRGVHLPGEQCAGSSPEDLRRRLEDTLAEAEQLDREQPGDAVVDTDRLTVDQAAQHVEDAAMRATHRT